jgi:hypothetical protein
MLFAVPASQVERERVTEPRLRMTARTVRWQLEQELLLAVIAVKNVAQADRARPYRQRQGSDEFIRFCIVIHLQQKNNPL